MHYRAALQCYCSAQLQVRDCKRRKRNEIQSFDLKELFSCEIHMSPCIITTVFNDFEIVYVYI